MRPWGVQVAGHLAVQVRAAHPAQVAAMEEEAARTPAAGVRAPRRNVAAAPPCEPPEPMSPEP